MFWSQRKDRDPRKDRHFLGGAEGTVFRGRQLGQERL